MTTASATSLPPPAPQSSVCPGTLRQRDPPIFSGTDDHDVDDWLSSYERVSRNNKWDDITKLTTVPFYLTGIAHLWFRNHESEVPSWTVFKTKFSEVFGRPAVQKLRAEQRLQSRSQQPGETFTSYIEDVIDLCKRVDVSMTEGNKIKHILKGIDEDAFQMLISKSPSTVAQVIELCQSYDELRRQRLLTRRPVPHQESLSGLTSPLQDPTLLSQIKAFVREEVARQLSLISNPPDSSSSLSPTLRHVIEEQVSEVLPLERAPRLTAPLTYADAVARPRPPTFRTPPPMPSPGFTSTPPRPPVHRVINPWRTADNRPICYSCGIPGHVARLCRRRPLHPRDDPRTAAYDHPLSYAPDRDLPLPRPSLHPVSDRRSPSPRRRSLSPMRRRPSTTDTEN